MESLALGMAPASYSMSCLNWGYQLRFEWAKRGSDDFSQRGDGIWIGFEGRVEFQLGGLDFRNSLAPGVPWGHRESGVKAPWIKPGLPWSVSPQALFSEGVWGRSLSATLRLQPWPCQTLGVTSSEPMTINLATCFYSLLWQDNAMGVGGRWSKSNFVAVSLSDKPCFS